MIPVFVLTKATDSYRYVQLKKVQQKYLFVQGICCLMYLMSIWDFLIDISAVAFDTIIFRGGRICLNF